ncbi:MAG: hypothetical protein A2269_05535 [Lentisphaerae bacterium RIFOXYA12_FULL_60_10]|nr:MAG: hypothetical protein A2269_05535 [Lentisphaerae bacterium RIFOXYA12_FULL_60_10]
MRKRLLTGFLGIVIGWLAGCSTPFREPAFYPVPRGSGQEPSAVSRPAAGPDAPEPPAPGLPALPDRSPVAGTAASPDATQGVALTIQPDTLVQVSVEEDPSLDGSYAVNKIGAIELNYIGPVILYNRTEREAESKIREVLINRHFRNATVRVRILRASYDKVKVDGAVNQPGLVPIGAGDAITLNDALLRAGGLRPTARGARVRIVRGGLLSALSSTLEGEEFSLMNAEGQPTIPDVSLRNNDVAYVFPSEAALETGGEREILVLGEVRKPGVYRFRAGEPCTLMHLLFKMGDLPPYANAKAIRVIRQDAGGVPVEQVVNASRILKEGDPSEDVTLENGDRVIVPARRISLF